MTMTESEPTILPALRGVMGSWVYYSCLMQFSELSSRVRFADEVHTHNALSEMIQRSIDEERIEEIAEYIRDQPQRFFNSLVVAVYGGEPNWHELFNVRSTESDPFIEKLRPETVESLGFLTLRGDENLFALDGQHRLAGIKSIVGEGYEAAMDDVVSVIFVAHEQSPTGLERTRRLFTTLNKAGRQVTKGDIIALDEDDVMAICVRRFIEQTDLFHGNRIAFVQSNNVPATNLECLTTIGNLYDVLTILFTQANFPLRKDKRTLETRRPEKDILDRYFDYAEEYFLHLRGQFIEMDEFFSAVDTTDAVRKYRGRHGGSALYRPIGLDIFTQIITRSTNDLSLGKAVELAARLPRELRMPPYDGLMWNQSNETIISRNKVLLREILCFMIGTNRPSYTEQELLRRYRRETSDDKAELPSRLV